MKRISLSVVLGVTLAATATISWASRNTSGTYSLPSSPFVTGTPISSSVMNSNLSDISSALTDSLSRSGYGGMSVPLKVPDGTVSAPAVTFTNEPGTGIYRIGSGDLGLAVSGVKRQEWTSSGASFPSGASVTGGATVAGGLTVDNVTVSGTIRPSSGTGTLDARGTGGASPAQILGASGPQSAGNVISIQNGSTVLATLNIAGDWNMQGHLITNLYGTPSASTDVATKGYVDGRVLTRGSVTFSGSASSTVGSCVKDQTTGQVFFAISGYRGTNWAGGDVIATLPYVPSTGQIFIMSTDQGQNGTASFATVNVNTSGQVTMRAWPGGVSGYFSVTGTFQ